MSVQAKKIDEKLRLRGEPKKSKVLFYLPVDLQKEFKKVCSQKGFSLTSVVEELVKEYVEDSKKSPLKSTE